MKVRTKELYQSCYGKYAIAAVNVFTMEQVLSLFRAAEKTRSPIIVQTTPVARNYASPEMLIQMVKAAANVHPKTVYALHLDHGNEEHALAAIESDEYTSVMIDASHDPIARNIRRSKAIVERARPKNISVEAELGVLSGVEDDIKVDEAQALYTHPDEAERFVAETGCDSLAVAVGTGHGAYKFSGARGLQFDILKKIQDRLPRFPLVLHGASEVMPEQIAAINRYGGRLKSNARGLGAEDLKKAIPYGICKVNIATDLRLLWTAVHRKFFYETPDLFDPVIPGKTYIEAIENFLISKFKTLGSVGKNADFL